ncbi:hypothetical protein ES703_09376 [subsurface metagenome]
MAEKRRVWTNESMDLGFKIDNPENVEKARKICLEKVPAMLEEGVKAGVIVMVADGSIEWSILDYEGYGKLCRKYELRPGMFQEVIEAD